MQVDNLEIVRSLGNSTKRKFNSVYLVKQKNATDLFILKVFQKTNSKAFHEALFRQESSFQFKHPHLPQIVKHFEDETTILTLYKYHEGKTWNEYWKTIPSRDRLSKLKLITEKMQPLFNELREKQIIHADLKPSNILIHERENELDVKLIDFGISIQQINPLDRKTLFSLGYSAPEIILEQYDLVDQTADFYSLGIMIWQLYENRLPFHHPNPGISTNLQITLPLPEGNKIPKELIAILQKMCFKSNFKKPPHHYKLEEMRLKLNEAKQNRFAHFEEIFHEFDSVKEKNWLLRLKQIFSKP